MSGLFSLVPHLFAYFTYVWGQDPGDQGNPAGEIPLDVQTEVPKISKALKKLFWRCNDVRRSACWLVGTIANDKLSSSLNDCFSYDFYAVLCIEEKTISHMTLIYQNIEKLNIELT